MWIPFSLLEGETMRAKTGIHGSAAEHSCSNIHGSVTRCQQSKKILLTLIAHNLAAVDWELMLCFFAVMIDHIWVSNYSVRI